MNIVNETPGSLTGETSSQVSEYDTVLREIAYAPPQPVSMDIPEGSRWGADGRYLVRERIGRGGMGTVYLAHDTLLGRDVALKLLDTRASEGEERLCRERLLREARIAARIEHERIARVYDVGEHLGLAFVAMELVRGLTLRQWMKDRIRPPEQIERITVQIAEGLAALHRSGVVHRDLKPENIMLSDSANVKLLDFGLARQARAEPADGGMPAGARTELVSASVNTTTFGGTPGYMAPEQLAGTRPDARVDVFAFGVIVYELVTGQRPFRVHAENIFAPPIEEPVSFASEGWASMPHELSAIVERALAFDPGRRYADGEALCTALRDLATPRSLAALSNFAAIGNLAPIRNLAPIGNHAPPAPAPRILASRRAWSLVIIGGTVLCSGLVAWLALRRARPPTAGDAAPISISGMVRLPGGRATIGSTPAEIEETCDRLGSLCVRESLEREQPAHQVTLSPFFLDQYEVRNDDYARWLSESAPWPTVEEDPETREKVVVRDKADTVLASLHEGFGGIAYDGNRFVARPGAERRPVVQVTWDGARMFCESRGKRLPTEAEWEFAARGATKRPFPWGDASPTCDGVVFARQKGGQCHALGPGAVDVTAGPLDTTPEGIRGLGGNVAEWVHDAYGHAFYPPCGECLNPRVEGTRASASASEQRVYRGGSWATSTYSRTTARGHWTRIETATNIGFRCAADDPSAPGQGPR